MSKNPEVSGANTDPELGFEELAGNAPFALSAEARQLADGLGEEALESLLLDAIQDNDLDRLKPLAQCLPSHNTGFSLDSIERLVRDHDKEGMLEFIEFMKRKIKLRELIIAEVNTYLQEQS